MIGLVVVGVLAAVVVAGTLVSAWVLHHAPPGDDDVSFLDLMDDVTEPDSPSHPGDDSPGNH